MSNGGATAGASGLPAGGARAQAFRGPLAGGLHAAADAITQTSQRLWSARKISEGVADAGQDVADGLESSASYLETHDARKMLADAVALARRYPVQAVLVAGAVGLMAGWLLRATTARSQARPLPASHRYRRSMRS
jgi:ElaB/YqjD/DUF883 family membrane-anchored ribosome-binding protein